MNCALRMNRNAERFMNNNNKENTPKGSKYMIIMDDYRQQLTATIAALKQAGESL